MAAVEEDGLLVGLKKRKTHEALITGHQISTT